MTTYEKYIAARKELPEHPSERQLDELDVLWFGMTPQEREAVELDDTITNWRVVWSSAVYVNNGFRPLWPR